MKTCKFVRKYVLSSKLSLNAQANIQFLVLFRRKLKVRETIVPLIFRSNIIKQYIDNFSHIYFRDIHFSHLAGYLKVINKLPVDSPRLKDFGIRIGSNENTTFFIVRESTLCVGRLPIGLTNEIATYLTSPSTQILNIIISKCRIRKIIWMSQPDYAYALKSGTSYNRLYTFKWIIEYFPHVEEIVIPNHVIPSVEEIALAIREISNKRVSFDDTHDQRSFICNTIVHYILIYPKKVTFDLQASISEKLIVEKILLACVASDTIVSDAMSNGGIIKIYNNDLNDNLITRFRELSSVIIYPINMVYCSTDIREDKLNIILSEHPHDSIHDYNREKRWIL